MVREDSEQTRTVDTPQGPLAYVLVRKPVKNRFGRWGRLA